MNSGLRIRTLVDTINWLRERTDVYDYLLTKKDPVINMFLFGNVNPELQRPALEVHEKLTQLISAIMYSDIDYVWNSESGVQKQEDAEGTGLYFDDDIKNLIDSLEEIP